MRQYVRAYLVFLCCLFILVSLGKPAIDIFFLKNRSCIEAGKIKVCKNEQKVISRLSNKRKSIRKMTMKNDVIFQLPRDSTKQLVLPGIQKISHTICYLLFFERVKDLLSFPGGCYTWNPTLPVLCVSRLRRDPTYVLIYINLLRIPLSSLLPFLDLCAVNYLVYRRLVTRRRDMRTSIGESVLERFGLLLMLL